MEIKFSGKEKQFYYSILEKFQAKRNKKEPISISSLNFSSYSDENFRIFHGVTKIVLVPKNKGARYVLKIPVGDINYCEGEVDAYMRAEECEMEKFFAPTEFFDMSMDCKVYIQLRTRANPYDEDEEYWSDGDWSELTEDSVEEATENGMSEQLIDEIIDCYGSGEAQDFIDFCNMEHLDDIHSGNFGFYKGRPMVFDYSGIGDQACRMRGLI